MTIVLSPAEILEAVKNYAVDNLEIPEEAVDTMELQWFNTSTGKYEDTAQETHRDTIQIVTSFEADGYSSGPYR